MILKNIMNHLQLKGWQCAQDEIGNKYSIIEINGLQIQFLPLLDKRKDYVIFSLEPSVSIKSYSDACSFLMQEENDFEPLISRYGWPQLSLEINNPPQRKFKSLTLDDIDSLEIEALEWANQQDISKALKYYADLPTDSAGSLPLNHLAALVIQRDKKRLEYYQYSFLNGNRLGFVPYITDEIIDRALKLVKN